MTSWKKPVISRGRFWRWVWWCWRWCRRWRRGWRRRTRRLYGPWRLKIKSKGTLIIWFINYESHFMNWNMFINHQLSRSSIILSSRSPTWPFFSLFHFIRRFWNQIFTCLSVSDVVFANCIRRSAFKYGWRQNSASNSISWRDEYGWIIVLKGIWKSRVMRKPWYLQFACALHQLWASLYLDHFRHFLNLNLERLSLPSLIFLFAFDVFLLSELFIYLCSECSVYRK